LSFAFTAPPDLGKDQMQFPRFQPHLACLGFQFPDGPNRHPGKCFVSRASFLHVPMHFKNSFFETESSAPT